jgi:saccharopine dehydrogenase (NAD+, L-lysine-forming)
MVEACLVTGAHYLDITGEITVFESIQSRHREAIERGIVLLPGVGFDAVPSDCLAKMLSESLPDATDLKLAFTTAGGSTSRGTRKTMVEGLASGGAIRRDGKIVQVPFAHDVKLIPFSCGSRNAMTIAWGDLSTAFHSTGIPNIRVYTGIPQGTLRIMRFLIKGAPLMKHRVIKRITEALIDRSPPGPSSEQRRNARSYFWGRVRSCKGRMSTATLEIPEGYTFTSTTAVESVRRVLQGIVQPGFSTPSTAFGAEFINDLPEVSLGTINTS